MARPVGIGSWSAILALGGSSSSLGLLWVADAPKTGKPHLNPSLNTILSTIFASPPIDLLPSLCLFIFFSPSLTSNNPCRTATAGLHLGETGEAQLRCLLLSVAFFLPHSWTSTDSVHYFRARRAPLRRVRTTRRPSPSCTALLSQSLSSSSSPSVYSCFYVAF